MARAVGRRTTKVTASADTLIINLHMGQARAAVMRFGPELFSEAISSFRISGQTVASEVEATAVAKETSVQVFNGLISVNQSPQ